MSQDFVLSLGSTMLSTASMLAAPILLTSLVVGLLVGIIQVATQIQEMTLTFVPKIIAAVVVVLVMGGWMLSLLVEYARETFLLAARTGV